MSYILKVRGGSVASRYRARATTTPRATTAPDYSASERNLKASKAHCSLADPEGFIILLDWLERDDELEINIY